LVNKDQVERAAKTKIVGKLDPFAKLHGGTSILTRQCDTCQINGKYQEDFTCSTSDPNDGLPLTCVGEWAHDKHERLRKYVDISRAVRKKFLDGPGGATYIELFSGPGKSRIQNSNTVIDGSALCAVRSALESSTPFTTVHVGDDKPIFVASAKQRLEQLHASVEPYTGLAEDTVGKIVANLNPKGLHFALLDPYDLKALPFSIIEKLAQLERMDILIHVSVQDLQRNLKLYIASEDSRLDTFVPGWREEIDIEVNQEEIRRQILNYWLRKIESLDMKPGGVESIELVKGSRNQPLYWLVFAARHDRANEFWDKIRNIDPQKDFRF